MGELPKDHQRANRLHLAMLDMQDARRYLDAYAELDSQSDGLKAELSHTLRETLIVAAIVAYCRPFSRNQSPGQAVKKLSIDEFWWITNNSTQRALHVLIITKRDTFVAHADWDARSTEIVELTRTGVKRTFSVPDVMEGLDPKEFSALALEVEKDCFYQAMALQHRIHTEQGQAG
ncbi:hypothetical protein ABIB38_004646 [Massilia sp. UYP11]|uniref:hypothetical protein n=1 Tax=Massilia sp. UYP11 TaxID=1756385 RepID=UPI003D249040